MGTITKALEMLDLFDRLRPEIGLGEFVRLTGREKATVHRHLVELEANGFLEKDPQSRTYRLGAAILRLSGVREATQPTRKLLRPIVTELANEIEELVHATTLQGNRLSYVFHHEPQKHGTQVNFDEAEVLPLNATSSGISVLAFSDSDYVDAFLSRPLQPFTPQTPTDPTAIRALLTRTRDTGFGQLSKSFDEEVTSIGMAIFDANARPVGAISISLPTSRTLHHPITEYQPLLAASAMKATESLGGRLPELHPMKV